MNKIYSLVWNGARGQVEVASELARAHGKSRGGAARTSKRLAGLRRGTGMPRLGGLARQIAIATFSTALCGTAVTAYAASGIQGGTGAGTAISASTSDPATTVNPDSIAIGSGSSADYDNIGTNMYDRLNPYYNAAGTNGSTTQLYDPVTDYFSTAIGTDADALGGSVAVGMGAKALKDANGNNTVALAVAIGAQAKAENVSAIAIGPGTLATGNTSLAMGRQSAATADYAQAIGNVSAAVGEGSLAIGHSATATGNRSVAIGAADIASAGGTGGGTGFVQTGTNYQTIGRTLATGAHAVAFGSGANATADNALAIGAYANAKGTQSVAIGGNNTDGAQALADNAVAIGQSMANAATDVAIGTNSKATGGGSGHGAVAIGATQSATGAGAVAIGDPNITNGTGAVAIGADNVAAGDVAGTSAADGAIAIGNANSAIGQGSVALGNGSTAATPASLALGDRASVQGMGGVALGANAKAANTGDVALGMGSTTSAVGTSYYNPGHGTLAGKATSALSVGSHGAERQIQNVAPGSNSTDAVNVSQLEALADSSVKYDDTTKTNVTLGGPTSTDGGVTGGTTITNVHQGDVSANSTDVVNGSQLYTVQAQANKSITFAGDGGANVDRELGQTLNVTGGASGTLTSNNIGVTGNGTDTLSIQLAQDVDLGNAGSVTTGNTVVNNGGVTITGGTNPVSLTNTGLDNGGNTITNVATGTNSTDAVNLAQLNTAAAAATSEVKAGTHVASVAKTIDPTDNHPIYTVNAEGVTVSAAGTGVTVTPTTDATTHTTDYTVGLSATTQTTLDNAVQYDDATHAKVTLGGTSAPAPVALANVKDGAVNATSTDAVNGSQLYATNQDVSTNTTNITNNTTNIANNTGNITNNATNISNVLNGDAGPFVSDNSLTTTQPVSSGADSAAGGFGASATGGQSTVIGNNASDNGNAAATVLGEGASIASGISGSNVALGHDATVSAGATNVTGVTLRGTNYTFAGGTPAGVVSVGNTGHERQITNVAAGQLSSSSTDAVNGSQLYATNQAINSLSGTISAGATHYYSVNDGGTQGNNYANDGATGANSLAAGVAASAIGSDATAVGHGAVADGLEAVAMGKGANASDHSVAIGADTQATDNAVVLGKTADGGSRSVAIGVNTQADNTRFQVAPSSYVTSHGSVAIGSGAVAHMTQVSDNGGMVALGQNAHVSRSEGIAVGKGADVSAPDGLAIGVAAGVIGANAVALGLKSQADGESSIALGNGATVEGNGSISVGTASHVAGANSGAFGDPNTVAGSGSYAFGNNNTVDADNAFVLGSDVKLAAGVDGAVALGNSSGVTQAGGVALGEDSVAATASGAAGYDPATNTASVRATPEWKSTLAAVSVGDASNGKTRQITGVAAGSADTDAVNVVQLRSLRGAVTGAGLDFAGDAGTTVHRNLGQTVTLKGGAGGPLSNNNIAVTANGTDTLSIQLAQDVNLGNAGSVTLGNTVVNNGGVSITGGTSTVSLTNTGLNNGGNTITNVKGGVNLTDAVNLAQLNTAAAAATSEVKAGTHVASVAKTTDPTDNHPIYTVNAEGATVSTAGTGVTVTPTTDAITHTTDYTVGLSATTQTTLDNAVQYDDATHAKVTLGGTSATASVALTNVKDGAVNATSTDAVNGSQLYATNQDVSTNTTNITNNAGSITNNTTNINNVLNGDAGPFVSDNSLATTQPVSSGADSAAGGFGASATGGQSTVIGNNASDNGNAAATVLGEGASIASGISGSNVAIGQGSQVATAAVANRDDTIRGTTYTYAGGVPVGVVSVGTMGNERQITNVAAGQVSSSSTDAVNGSQLYATNQAINNLGGSIATNATHYYSVNDGGTQGNNYANDGATGANSLAAGVNAKASAAGTVAVGHGAVAKQNYAVAVGTNAFATNAFSTAVGFTATAGGISSTAVGGGATAQASRSTAVGHNAFAQGQGTVAVGDNAHATATNAISIGTGNIVSGANSGALGDPNTVKGSGSYAFGNNNAIAANNAFVLGNNVTIAAGRDGALALGSNASVTQSGGMALGSGSAATTAAGTVGYDPATGAASTATTPAWKSTLAAVSVGDAANGKTRQITGVAAGSVDTDAVNVAQLKSVAGTVTGSGLDFAGDAGTSVHRNLGQALTIAGGETDTTKLSTGKNIGVVANGTDTLNIQLASNLTDIDSLTINNGPTINQNGIDMHNKTVTNVGGPVNGGDAVNLDYFNSHSARYYSVNDGGTHGANYANDGATGLNAVAAGVGAVATGAASIALGQGAQAQAGRTISIGAGNVVKGVGSGAIGDPTVVTGAGSYSVGNKNAIASDNAFVLGSNVSVAAGLPGAVVLGNNSTVSAATPVPNVTINGSGYTVAGGNPAPGDVVSVGSAAAPRQIQNVAAGRVTASSTDAVNGSQLYATNQAIGTLTGTTGQPITFAGDAGTPVARKLGETLNVTGGATSALTSNNIGVTGNGTDALSIQLAQDVDLGNAGSVTTGNTVVNNGGVTITGGTNPVSLTDTGLDNGGNTITNVATGTNSTDAVNVAQLNTAAAAATTEVKAGTHVASVAKTTDPTDNHPIYTVNAEGAKVTAAGNHVTVISTTDASTHTTDYAVGLSAGTQTVIDNAVQYDDATHASVTLGGTSATAPVALVNVKDGTVNATSTDAVNGSQLYATNQNVSTNTTNITNNTTNINNVLNGDAGPFVSDNSLTTTQPVSSGADSAAGGFGASATGDQSTVIGNNASDNGNANATVLGEGAGIASGIAGSNVALGQGSQVTVAAVANPGDTISGTAYTYAGDAPVGVVSVGGAGHERQITNVAAGQLGSSSTDAVNGSQLYATNQAIDSLSSSVTANATHYYSVNDGGTQGANYANNGATGLNAVAAGVGASAAGANSIALGNGANAASDNAISIGNGNTVSGANSGAFGDPNTVSGTGSYAIGNNNAIDADNAFVLGNNIIVPTNLSGAVVLGSASTVSSATAVPGVTVNGVTYTGFAGATPVAGDVLSVGSTTAPRQIQNVAAGQVTSTSTDAVNGSQLYAVANELGNVKQAASQGWNLSVNGDTANASNVAPGATVDLSSSDGNIVVSKTGTGIDLALNPNIDLGSSGSVTAGNTTVDTGGVTVTGGPNANVRLANTGLDNGNNQIVNVASGLGGTSLANASGSTLTNAANIGDLQTAVGGITNASKGGGFGLSDDAGTAVKQDLGKTIQVTGDNNITTVADATSHTLQVQLDKDLTDLNSVTVGGGNGNSGVKLSNNGSITMIGTGGASSTISVQQGAPGLGGTNGQARRIVIQGSGGTPQQVATLGDGLHFQGNQGPTIDKKLNETVAIKGGLSNTASASDRNVRVDSVGGELRIQMANNLNLGNGGSVTTGGTTVNGQGVTIQGGPSVTSAGIDAGSQKVTNVAPGTSATDAVNVSQLNSALQGTNNWAKAYTDQQVNALRDHADAGIASAMAMAGVPQAYAPNQSTVGVGVGSFEGESAIAVGVSTISDNGRYILKLNATGDTRGNAGVSVGAAIVW